MRAEKKEEQRRDEKTVKDDYFVTSREQGVNSSKGLTTRPYHSREILLRMGYWLSLTALSALNTESATA